MNISLTRAGGVAGLVFVAILVLANVVLTVAGFPTPSAPAGGEITDPQGIRVASALLPAAWLAATIFAAGLFTARDRSPWALVGLAGVLMQSVTFAAVEATRLALTVEPAAGLWALHRALFGLNQVFLATALIGFTVGAGLARWHAGVGLAGAVLLFASATAGPWGVGAVNPLALAGLVGWLLWLVWIVAHSVRLVRR